VDVPFWAWAAAPLVLVEVSDVIFAVDSIPAIVASWLKTREPARTR
jgi:predicted tellurium resistance membrane protein TerC